MLALQEVVIKHGIYMYSEVSPVSCNCLWTELYISFVSLEER